MQDVSIESIRHAIELGDYAAALEQWERYAGRLRQTMVAGDLCEFGEVTDLMAWSRPLLLCARAHVLDRLNALHVAGVYAGTAPTRSRLLRTTL